ncbi:MAG: hypothetical protein J0M00_02555 [Burkholderiales bacterium]|nr:hypothetical protein [Burkholderiales bacterium]
MARYGWVLNVERCNYLDPEGGNEKVFNLNLARPWAEEQKPDDPRGPQLGGAGEKLGDLLFPWSWANLKWVFFARDAQGAWNKVDGAIRRGVDTEIDEGQPGGPEGDLQRLRKAVRKEVEGACSGCEHPFSQTMDDFWIKGKRSYVHALAPLTHWPALVSEKVLRLSWFVSMATKDLGAVTHLAAFPEFDIGKTDLLDAQMRLDAAGLRAPSYDLTGQKKVEVAANYKDGDVAFLCLAAATQDVAFTKGAPMMSQGRATASAIRESVQNELLPARLVRVWLQKGKRDEVGKAIESEAVRTGMRMSLFRTLGEGREPRDEAQNVLELFLDTDQARAAAKVREILRPFTADDATGSAALTAASAVLAGDRGDSWSEKDRTRWKERSNDIQRLCGAANPDITFEDAWTSTAEMVLGQETGAEIYGPWLAHVADAKLSADAETDWQKIRAKLLAPKGVRLDVLVRGRGGALSAGQWQWAKALVRELDPEQPAEVAVPKTWKLLLATARNTRSTVGKAAYARMRRSLGPFMAQAIRHWVEHMHASMQRSRTRPRDRGIRVEFSTATDPGSPELQMLRGYAVALCGGVLVDETKPWLADAGRAAWLTDTALRYELATGKSDWLDFAGMDPMDLKSTAWMHETLGATENDGEVVVSQEYVGLPFSVAAYGDDDAMPYEPGKDGFESVDFGWRKAAAALPRMGFGMLYKAAATPLDNAGGVVEARMRKKAADDTPLFAQLVDASSLDEFQSAAEALQFRSSEPPGAPAVVEEPPAALYELSEETQAHAWQHGLDPRLPRGEAMPPRSSPLSQPRKVALLSHDENLFPGRAKSCTFVVRPPRAQFAFIEQWLATDRLLIETKLKDEVSDERLARWSSDQIGSFVERFRERVAKGKAVATPDYHPAVSALGIEVAGLSFQDAKHVEFKRLRENELEPAGFQLEIEVKAGSGAEIALTVDAATGTATVHVPYGQFARVRVYSLVHGRHFAAGRLAQCRFHDGIQSVDIPQLSDWRAFGPAEYWFEALPEWNGKAFEKAGAALRFAGPEEVEAEDGKVFLVSPNLVTSRIDFLEGPWVHWVKGLYVQRHDWHWTGYPVRFPSKDQPLDKWLPTFAGVETFRESSSVVLATAFDGRGRWKLGADADDREVFFRHELLVGRRPARYVVAFARPILRFARWMNPKLGRTGPASLEQYVWGGGLLAAGRPEPGTLQRLPVPVLRHAIPLTATYAPTEVLARAANGALLVFDEAIRRTDDLAKLGGIGDVLEVDLVETRVAGVAEMGGNPIFHGRDGPWIAGQPLELKVNPPFGLTFDIGSNPKVGQTALVVQPRNACGRWILAKARVRRAVLPETELGTLVGPGSAPPGADAKFGAWYTLANRIEGEDAVPQDIVIDVPAGTVPAVRVRIGDVDKDVAMPADADKAATRFLLSWHKARWSDKGDPLPAWRCQVLAQEREENTMAWRTVKKSSGHENAACELPQAYRQAEMAVGIGAAPPDARLRRVRLSDYTDPVWLTFIGSFGHDHLGTPHSFVFRRNKTGALQLQRREAADAGEVPLLRGLDESLAGTDPRWHLVLVFRDAKDVTRGKAGTEGGMLVAAYRKVEGEFQELPRDSSGAVPDLTGCRAHVITLQRVNALSEDEETDLEKIATLGDLLDRIFPSQEPRPKESLLRFLPEYLGPIDVDA